MAHRDLAIWQMKEAINRQIAAFRQLAELAERVRVRAKYFFMQQLDAFDQMGDQSGMTFRDVADAYLDLPFLDYPGLQYGLESIAGILDAVHRDGVLLGLGQTINPMYRVVEAVDRDGVLLGLGQTLNPAYGIVENANALWHAIEDRDMDAAERAVFGLVTSSIATVTFALGAVAVGQQALARIQLSDEGSFSLFGVGPAAETTLARKLAGDEAASIFTPSGTLTNNTIQNSRIIMEGVELNNPTVIQTLTADGSNIADWAKYSTSTVPSPSGPFQVHYYRNQLTGAVNYTIDYKVVFNRLP